ncbi:MAG: hypothetical protein ABI881_06710 [Betaproteobacteria bacterium]
MHDESPVAWTIAAAIPCGTAMQAEWSRPTWANGHRPFDLRDARLRCIPAPTLASVCTTAIGARLIAASVVTDNNGRRGISSPVAARDEGIIGVELTDLRQAAPHHGRNGTFPPHPNEEVP